MLPGTPPELASAAVAMIADSDPDRWFEEGWKLMLAGLGVSPGGSREGRGLAGLPRRRSGG